MKHILLSVTALLCILCIRASAQDYTDTSCYATKEFVIVQSTKDYNTALKTAKAAAKQMKFKLDLRGLKKNAQLGLAQSKKSCIDEFGFAPCYVARGRWDDGNYISIEYSTEYDGFAKGYYIVIVSSGVFDAPETKSALDLAKQFYADAYLKRSKVYVCCIH